MTWFGCRFLTALALLVVSAIAATPVSAQPAPIAQLTAAAGSQLSSNAIDEKELHPKVRGSLRGLLPQTAALLGDRQVQPFPLAAEGRIPVAIYGSPTTGVMDALQSIGASAANSAEGVVEAYVLPSDLPTLSGHSSVRRIEVVDRAQQLVVSQGRVVHNANAWIAGGHVASGVRVGIIDSFGGIQVLIGTELPAPAAARCYSSVGVHSANLAVCDTGSNHGTAVAESLVDVAPGVSLFVANPISKLDFINTIAWMTSQGVNVINFSAAWTWDGYGDGTSPYADSPLVGVDAAVQGGAVFVAAAGNHGRSSWFGAWQDLDANNFLEFSGTSELNGVVLGAGERLSLQARWDDSWTSASRDIDLALYDSSLNLVASSVAPQTGQLGDTPFEFLSYTAPSTGVFYFALRRFSGLAPSGLQVQAFTSQSIQFSTSGGSIANPAETANPGALAVGAAAWDTPTTIETFSSKGPTPDGRVKPDLVGADRADTVSLGPSGFFGTSQASPHVAGLAALVRGAFPAYTPVQVASYLKGFAQPRGGAPNNTWGYGLAWLPNLCTFSVTPVAVDASAAGGPVAITVASDTGCAWTALSNAPWITISSGTPGSGNGTVHLSVSANQGAARSGTVTIAGTTVTVSQAGAVIVPPGPPRNFTALSVIGNAVTFQWSAPETGPQPTGYVLEGGTLPGQVLASIGAGAGPTFTMVVPTGAFYVRLYSMAGALRSGPSNEIRIFVNVPAPPSAPTGLLGLVNGSSLGLSWTNTAAGGPPTRLLLNVSGSLSTSLPLPVSEQFSFTGVPPGTYVLTIVAINASGSSAPSNPVMLTFPGACTGPAEPPVNVVTARNGNTVSVSWSQPASGAAVQNYTLVVSGAFNGAFVTTGRQMAGVVGPGSYSLSVIANNACGSSSPTAPQTVVVP